MCKPRLDEDSLVNDFIAMAMSSVADLCVIPMQDYLNLGSEAMDQYTVHSGRQLCVENEEERIDIRLWKRWRE